MVFAMSCVTDSCSKERTYIRYDQVFVTPDDYRPSEVNFEEPRAMKQPGKIYFYQNLILINEVREGIHFVDNSNPKNPQQLGFLPIPGNHDMAIQNDVLYADGYTDLVLIDISTVSNPRLLDRREDVFQSHYFGNAEGITSHYEPTEVTETIDCDNPEWGQSWFRQGNAVFLDQSLWSGNAETYIASGPTGGPQVNQTGQGGSMARFTITKNHLYAVGSAEIFSLPIAADGSVGPSTETDLPWGIETIFPYEDLLFLGANNGMHIMSLDDPDQPKHESTFTHANACDPVVVQNDIAYVTLRGGTTCGGFNNQLDVLDVSDIHNPELLHTYSMSNPHGLAVLDNLLFICEGEHGLKVFDVDDISQIDENQYSHLTGFHAFDAIALRGTSLLVIGDDGFRQYDFSAPTNMELMSHIYVNRP
jgi:hypothetical protein